MWAADSELRTASFGWLVREVCSGLWEAVEHSGRCRVLDQLLVTSGGKRIMGGGLQVSGWHQWEAGSRGGGRRQVAGFGRASEKELGWKFNKAPTTLLVSLEAARRATMLTELSFLVSYWGNQWSVWARGRRRT